jgi:hypothetical protein
MTRFGEDTNTLATLQSNGYLNSTLSNTTKNDKLFNPSYYGDVSSNIGGSWPAYISSTHYQFFLLPFYNSGDASENSYTYTLSRRYLESGLTTSTDTNSIWKNLNVNNSNIVYDGNNNIVHMKCQSIHYWQNIV